MNVVSKLSMLGLLCITTLSSTSAASERTSEGRKELEIKSFVYNGCNIYLENTFRIQDVHKCCFVHDMEYILAGTSEVKYFVEERLGDCHASIGKETLGVVSEAVVKEFGHIDSWGIAYKERNDTTIFNCTNQHNIDVFRTSMETWNTMLQNNIDTLDIELDPEAPTSIDKSRMFQTTGCSNEIDGLDMDLVTNCCVDHQLKYWSGGEKELRNQADDALYSCVFEQTQDIEIADEIRDNSSISPYSTSAQRWGFAWSWGHFYKKLSTNERTELTEQLTWLKTMSEEFLYYGEDSRLLEAERNLINGHCIEEESIYNPNIQ